MLADRLSKAWDARRRSTAIDPVMRFSDEGLVLGAGTVLAKSDESGEGAIALDPSEPETSRAADGGPSAEANSLGRWPICAKPPSVGARATTGSPPCT